MVPFQDSRRRRIVEFSNEFLSESEKWSIFRCINYFLLSSVLNTFVSGFKNMIPVDVTPNSNEDGRIQDD
jgi:hypothetical protein